MFILSDINIQAEPCAGLKEMINQHSKTLLSEYFESWLPLNTQIRWYCKAVREEEEMATFRMT